MDRVELLAPAGDLECLKVAVQTGANAVYFGAEEFNARVNGRNFEKQELIEAIIDVKSGNKQPDKCKKGRPCKKSFLGKEPNDDARFDEVISECEKLIKLRQELKEDVERILNEEFEKLKKRILNKILN